MAGTRKWLLPAATGLAGLAAGFMLGSHQGEPDAPALSSAVTTATGAALTAEDVRRVIREELAVRAPDSGPAQKVAAPPAPAVTAREAAASSRAQSVLEIAIARRVWTEQDADAMREAFPELNRDQQAEFLRQYALAVNQGRLVPQTERVPF